MLRPAPAESRTCRRRAFAAVRIAGRLRSRTRPAANARRTRGRVRCLRCGRRPPGPAIRKQKREGRMPPAFERLRPSGNGAALPKRPMRCGSATWGCPTGPENRKSPLPEFIPAGVKSLKSDLSDSSFSFVLLLRTFPNTQFRRVEKTSRTAPCPLRTACAGRSIPLRTQVRGGRPAAGPSCPGAGSASRPPRSRRCSSKPSCRNAAD